MHDASISTGSLCVAQCLTVKIRSNLHHKAKLEGLVGDVNW